MDVSEVMGHCLTLWTMFQMFGLLSDPLACSCLRAGVGDLGICLKD